MSTVFANQEQFAHINTDPASAVAEFEQILLSNSGEDAFESAIKLLAAKLVDEIQSLNGSPEQFRQHSSHQETHSAITALYKEAASRWPLLNGGDSLDISPSHLSRSIRPLIGWRLRGSDLQWLDATLERLVSRDAKGNLGQYFTPRDVVRLCVDILNPTATDLVIDPACGSAGFLFEAVRHASEANDSQVRCLGIDFSARSVKVATLLAAALDDGTISISKANSLDGRAYRTECPHEWAPFLSDRAASDTKRARQWGSWNQLGCDVLLTNPPFAGDIDEFELLEAYEAQHDGQPKKVVTREHLFLERAVDLLKPGGRLAIVLPQGVLANPTASYLRTWLFRKCRIVGVIGLHQYAFLPYTGVKTAIVILSKPSVGESIPENYSILFASSKASGKDSSGKPSGTSDYESVGEAFKEFVASEGFPWAGTLSGATPPTATVERVPFSEVLRSGRLDAEYYDPIARSLTRRLAQLSNSTISKHVETRIPRFKKRDYNNISYVDISCVDGRTGLTFPSTIESAEAPSRASYLVSKGDVLVSTVRPDRNVVALVTAQDEDPTVASNGFCVLRPKDIDAELLFAYCKTEAFRQMLTMHATASMYPTVGDRDVMSIPFLQPPEAISAEVVSLIRSSLEMIEKAHRQMEQAVKKMDAFLAGTTT